VSNARRIACMLVVAAALAGAAPAQAAQGPVTLSITTRPRLIGVTFLLDGRPFASHGDGVATITTTPGVHRLRVLPWRDSDDTRRATFSRWRDDVFSAGRTVRITRNTTLEVGMDVTYRVRFRYLDLQGHPVDPHRVQRVTLVSTLGAAERFVGTSTLHWLPGTRVVRRPDGLRGVPVTFRVDDVQLGDSNVVFRSQQALEPSRDGEFPITLQLYTVHFDCRDALMGFGLGSAVRLKFPDGRWRSFPLRSNHTVTITGLPRGHYHVGLNSLGFSQVAPLSLSKDEQVTLEAYSYLDIGVLVLFALSLALGLLFVGRPHLLRRLVERVTLRRVPLP
jgi:hypothetical protein